MTKAARRQSSFVRLNTAQLFVLVTEWVGQRDFIKPLEDDFDVTERVNDAFKVQADDLGSSNGERLKYN